VADYGEVRPRSRKEWRAWLQTHHSRTPGIWLLFAKKNSGQISPSYNDAVEEALCFGWIDGLKHPVDDTYYKLLFTPRRPKSAWAASNKIRVGRLLEQGLVTQAGLAVIDAAKQSGQWDALDHVEAMAVPRELRRALDANAHAKRHWPTFTESQRKQFLYRLANARREETRAARIAQIVDWVANKVTPAQAYEARRSTTKSTKATKRRTTG
jgi:uncharacterized protein YdeI (YjbR/CyaY-like superfamily)